jgi:hypothetical protein
MKPYEKYLSHTTKLQDLLDIYLTIRMIVKDLGWSEQDLEKPPFYPNNLMSAFQRFEEKNKYLFNDTKSFTNVSWNEYLSYVQPLMKKIDELTPLD